jgi:peptidoglycan/LPS O-acetylase OafA/YrhL
LHRLDRWIDEAPLYVSAILLGTIFYRLAPQVHARIRRHNVAVALVSVVLFLITQILYSIYVHIIRQQTGTDGRFMANIAGLALLCGSAAMSESKLIRNLAPIGRFTYVTFLVHMLVLELLRAPMKSLPGYGQVPTALFGTVLVFAVSLGVSWLVARFRLFAWLRP